MNKRQLSFFMLAIISLFIMTVSGCQNDEIAEATEREQQPGSSGGDDSGDSGSGGSSSSGDEGGGSEPSLRYDTLTVAEFINGNFEGGVFVSGYIVGDCTKSIKYAEFEPPFTHQQALLIADAQNETSPDCLAAIQLPQGKKRDALNLVDHPEHFRHRITLFGYRTTYLRIAGMKDFSTFYVE